MKSLLVWRKILVLGGFISFVQTDTELLSYFLERVLILLLFYLYFFELHLEPCKIRMFQYLLHRDSFRRIKPQALLNQVDALTTTSRYHILQSNGCVLWEVVSFLCCQLQPFRPILCTWCSDDRTYLAHLIYFRVSHEQRLHQVHLS